MNVCSPCSDVDDRNMPACDDAADGNGNAAVIPVIPPILASDVTEEMILESVRHVQAAECVRPKQ